SAFYRPLGGNGSRTLKNQGHGGASLGGAEEESELACNGKVGQISASLVLVPQPVPHEEGTIHQKTEIVGLQLHPPGGLPVEQGGGLHRGRTPATQVIHQEFGGYAAVKNSFDQQHMLVLDIKFVAEENLDHPDQVVAVLRLDELAYHRHFEASDQVSQKNEAVLQHPEDVDTLAGVVVGDLPGHLPHPFLDLLCG